MFVYGYAYNVTNWVGRSRAGSVHTGISREDYIPPADSLSRGGHFSSVFSTSASELGLLVLWLTPPMSSPLAMWLIFFPTEPLRLGTGLTLRPGAFQNLYTGSSTTGMANFIGLRNFGGLPVVLARLNSAFPYFYDSYNRFALTRPLC
jgi:hypothetical protein